jgi:arylsulfatase A-like enzyme
VSITRRSFLVSTAAPLTAQTRRPPNFVVILIDDYGWTDSGVYGSDFYETPNINRLASQGVRFTQGYSACTVCSPSRAAIMTGRYPARLHLTDWIAGHNRPYAKLRPPEWTKHLPLEETTLAEALKTGGYKTCSIGKWHLGDPPFYPDKQGFDENIGGTFRGQPPSYFSPYKIETLKDGPAGEYLTDREGEEAATFVRRNSQNPFFLYLPHYAVHTPLQAKPELIEKYTRKARPGSPQTNARYAAMVESMDAAVGRLMAALDESGVADNTYVVFTSDNGGLLSSTTNLSLRAGKGSAYEGGVRVPLIVRGPGIRAGSVNDVPACGIDIFPTILELAGRRVPQGVRLDGESLAPLLLGRAKRTKRDRLFWHYPHYHPGGATPYSAIRLNDWRLVEFQEDNTVELYNLAEDVGEKNNLAERVPTKKRQLLDALHSWRKDVGAQMAEANPNYDPLRAKDPAPRKKT